MKQPNIVVMGVTGCGKSSLGLALANALGASYIEGDSYHPPQNIARMAAGIPLTDADRAGWLALLAQRLASGVAQGEAMVLACSALKRRYRDTLRQGDPKLLFVHLAGNKALIAERMAARDAHFMPGSLLDSQFHDLEEPAGDERCIRCDISQPLDRLLQQLLQQLAQHQ
ncbi:gluconokinase [Aquitalea magnusonii]|uniref:Gluconokinase n=1 Tax=Aquitalea magnusonii TaxID=332411 RepID=A0A318JYG1_9NEIS|nr:gluconokinase [Aquitalea magnusonii]PXX50586.1 gluconate kinase (SKI family) [Aquitalea magnusonii]